MQEEVGKKEMVSVKYFKMCTISFKLNHKR